MADMDVALLITRWLHVVAAACLLGGSLFVAMAMIPGTRAALDETTRARLHELVRKRWVPIVHGSITFLVLTGGYSFFRLAFQAKIKPMPYHAIFSVKLLAAIAVFFIAAVMVGRGQGFRGMHARRRTWLTVAACLGAFIILASGMLAQVRARSVIVPVSPRDTATDADHVG